MSENGDKSRWVRISNLYKRHSEKGTSLQSQNLAKRLDDDWDDLPKEDKTYVQLQVWDNKRKQGFLDNSEDAHLVIKRTELDDFIKYLQGLR
jgi:uncharacterized pyridoxal phosphate-containing UPF0001 family protein